jgi:hypothetical protein
MTHRRLDTEERGDLLGPIEAPRPSEGRATLGDGQDGGHGQCGTRHNRVEEDFVGSGLIAMAIIVGDMHSVPGFLSDKGLLLLDAQTRLPKPGR